MSHIWMPLYVGDYVKDTMRLSTIQHGAYILLIMEYWQSRSLPDDDEALAAIAKMSMADWKKHRPTLRRFFQDGWKHKRIEEELSKGDTRRDSAKKSADERWKKVRQKDANAYARNYANAYPDAYARNDATIDATIDANSQSQDNLQPLAGVTTSPPSQEEGNLGGLVGCSTWKVGEFNSGNSPTDNVISLSGGRR
jgi:uncharacterized protein YdaU (DUF1376 family)